MDSMNTLVFSDITSTPRIYLNLTTLVSILVINANRPRRHTCKSNQKKVQSSFSQSDASPKKQQKHLKRQGYLNCVDWFLFSKKSQYCHSSFRLQEVGCVDVSTYFHPLLWGKPVGGSIILEPVAMFETSQVLGGFVFLLTSP